MLLGGIMAWAGANGRLASAPEQILSAALSPFQKGASAVSGGVGGLLDKYARIDSIIAENEALKQENWELQDKLVEYDRLKAENDAYKERDRLEDAKIHTEIFGSLTNKQKIIFPFQLILNSVPYPLHL